ncbi:MAG: cyclopropane-fatty-acyl-phospholipid synthase family protein [Myxococcota bacterium]|nr:cyclopropane-fatty-acyl-phospholipid synthase family protein [Myxococcota bacterium]
MLLDRWLLRRALDAIGNPPFTMRVDDGPVVTGAEPVRIHLRLHDRRLLAEMLRGPQLAVAEAYVEGRLEVDGDLVSAVELAFQSYRRGPRWMRLLSKLLASRPELNTRARARRNVHYHYDLGNDFYRLWLDEQMVYTCAYFERPGMTLEEAQTAKLELVCRKLRLRPGERVVEAGCGWGALALHMAEHHGVTVRAVNVSTEQIRWAREQAERRGLASRVEFVQDDYRNLGGSYDAFVSVGMLEHVGRAHYAALGRVIDRCLEPEGRGLLHFIGHVHPMPMDPWLRRHIFPGAYIPALSEMLPVLEPFDLEIQDVENLRRHYARTLEHWLERFEKCAGDVERLTDARFVRTWRLYLASCIASFHEGSSVLYQVLFTRAGSMAQARLPMTREDLYTR